jgi:hypothetical protein
VTTPTDITDVIPNSLGAKLIRCTVTVKKEPPTVATVVAYLPIVAFSHHRDHSFCPLVISGPLVGWGELRASVVGCYVYGICLDDESGVTTSNYLYDSVAEFIEHSKTLATLKVASVRKEKNWPEHLIPTVSLDFDEEA